MNEPCEACAGIGVFLEKVYNQKSLGCSLKTQRRPWRSMLMSI
jgi:hypothetical protein